MWTFLPVRLFVTTNMVSYGDKTTDTVCIHTFKPRKAGVISKFDY